MEEKYKQIFVGKKIEKFEKKIFSIPTFLFGGLYLAYRKMLLHALIVSIFVSIMDIFAIKFFTNLLLMVLTMLCFRISFGLFFPLWYRKYYNNQVKKIMTQNSAHSEEELIKKIQKKGGTSVGLIFLFIILNMILSVGVNKILNFDNSLNFDSSLNLNNNLNMQDEPTGLESSGQSNSSSATNNIDSSQQNNNSVTSNGEYDVIENANINGYARSFDEYIIYIDSEQYKCEVEDEQLLLFVKDYEELYVNVYYKESNGNKIIVDFEVFNSMNNEKVENVQSEEELRTLLGHYNLGSYEEELTLVEVDDTPGFGTKNDRAYSYYTYIFENENGKKIEYIYRIYDDTENKSELLEINNKYKIKFDVEEGIMEYDYVIIDITPIQ